MDHQTSSDRLIASPADQVQVHGRTEGIPEKTTEQSAVIYDRTNVETHPNPEPAAGTVQSVSVNDPALSQREAHNAFVDPVGSIREDTLATANVLHVGCGVFAAEKLPLMFRNTSWREIRLDIDPEVEPDVLASITDMQVISDATVDAVYSSHNVEHLYPQEVPLALREMNRVLKPNGFAFIKLPDLQEVARYVAEGKLEDPLYISPMGAIAPLDILYGHRPALARGNTFMAHRTGFTGTTLASALIAAGFVAVMMQRVMPSFSLTAIAFGTQPDAEQMAIWRARLLPAADRPTVLYTLNG